MYLSILDHWILLNYFWAADNFLWTRSSQYPEEGRSIPHQLYQCGQAARRHLNCLWAYPSSWGNHPAHPQAPPRFGGPHRHHVNHQAVRWHHTERSLCSSETCGRIFTLWQESGLWRHWVHWLWQWKLPRIRLHGSTDYIKVRLRRPSATLSSLHQRPRGDEHRSEIRRDFANCKWVRYAHFSILAIVSRLPIQKLTISSRTFCTCADGCWYSSSLFSVLKPLF